MSSTKRPCARAGAQEEVVTNWKIVRIVLGLGVLAGGCLAVQWWTTHRAARQRAIVAKAPDAEPQPTAHGKSRQLRREVFVYNRRIPNGSEPAELPPRWMPGPLEAPQPTHFARAADSLLEGADLFELYAETAMGYAPLVAPPMIRPTFDEDDLLSELGFPKTKAKSTVAARMSLNQSRARANPPPVRPQTVVTIDLDDKKGEAEKLRRLVQRATAPKKPDQAAATAESEKETLAWAASDAPSDGWLALVDKRADFHGLAFRRGTNCKLTKRPAAALGQVSKYIGQNLPTTSVADYVERWASWYGGDYKRRRPSYHRLPSQADVGTSFLRMLASEVDQQTTSASQEDDYSWDQLAPALVQILQVRGRPDRQALVEALVSIRGPNATAGLAHRALFELSAEVRIAAAKALAHRPAKEFRAHLLAGLRYPWPAIADHAAAALVAADDRDAVLELVELLDKPNPTAPFVNEQRKWAVRELTRVNHMRNCLLCHAPSLASNDPVRGLVPIPGQSIPSLYYFEEQNRRISSEFVFVRADITYLKQDFSLTHPVKDRGAWPAYQRFDYFVRTRELTKEELEDIGRRQPAGNQDYPQREAVLYALRELTGRDFGRASEDWRVLVRK
jgi:hypothetical protein